MDGMLGSGDGGVLTYPFQGWHHMDIQNPLLLELLGPEILIMIFEQVCAESPEMLPCLRLMCRRFDQIAAPLSYRRINLSANKLVAVTGPFGRRNDILRNVHAHTRHVELRQLLDWDDVASLLAGCAQLDDLTASGNFLKTFPASNMISLTVQNRGFGQSVRPIYQFLTSCVNLETLRLFDLNDPSQPPNGRLPPVKCLLLQVRSWPYTPEEVHHLWNFSRLQDLEIPWHILGLMFRQCHQQTLPTYTVCGPNTPGQESTGQ
ncbi:hypothetical protein DL95DRAFT_503169 [Leptodontidium sp. 2 PMI_412]|nr:hypothetical protein DL95DRAFT_503169 [Leptodontidium sp. 2 PMI_412]